MADGWRGEGRGAHGLRFLRRGESVFGAQENAARIDVATGSKPWLRAIL